MPQLIICHKCGTILHEEGELKSPYEIVEGFEGKCPKCGRKLSYIPKTFEVKPVDEANKLVNLDQRRDQKGRVWIRQRSSKGKSLR